MVELTYREFRAEHLNSSYVLMKSMTYVSGFVKASCFFLTKLCKFSRFWPISKSFPQKRLSQIKSNVGESSFKIMFDSHTIYPRLLLLQKKRNCFICLLLHCLLSKSQALEFRTPLFPHLVPPAIMVWICVWKYIFEPFIHILQHFVLQLSRSTNFCF